MSEQLRDKVLKALEAAIRRSEDATGILRAAHNHVLNHNDYELAEIRIKAASAALSSALTILTQTLDEIKAGGQ
jgi:hypothetical protein